MKLRETTKYLFWVLIMEDEPGMLQQVVESIREEIGEVGIDSATTVDDAIAMIQRRRDEGIRYDLAILDFKVRQVRGANLEVDETVCKELRKDRVSVIHFTGYPRDRKVTRHMKKMHSEQDMAWARVGLVDKSDITGFLPHMLALIVPYHQEQVSNALKRKLEAVFGDLVGGDRSWAECVRSRPPTLGRKCATHTMIRLRQLIECNWPYLNESARDLIRRFFDDPNRKGSTRRRPCAGTKEEG